MIVYDLECAERRHRFECWFRSSDDFADQTRRGLIACPECHSTAVVKAPMAARLGRKGNQAGTAAPAAAATAAEVTSPAPPAVDPAAAAALAKLAALQRAALAHSNWVGPAFADQARAMHYGEQPAAPIHGEVSSAEASALVDEGVPVMPLLFPVVPPDQRN